MGNSVATTLAEAERVRDALFDRVAAGEIIGLSVEQDRECGWIVTVFVSPSVDVDLPRNVDGVQLRRRESLRPRLQ
jgi:hypothetical protein